jgi:hypothetical protein
MSSAGGPPQYIFSKGKLILELKMRKAAIQSSLDATAASPTKENFNDHALALGHH